MVRMQVMYNKSAADIFFQGKKRAVFEINETQRRIALRLVDELVEEAVPLIRNGRGGVKILLEGEIAVSVLDLMPPDTQFWLLEDKDWVVMRPATGAVYRNAPHGRIGRTIVGSLRKQRNQ